MKYLISTLVILAATSGVLTTPMKPAEYGSHPKPSYRVRSLQILSHVLVAND